MDFQVDLCPRMTRIDANRDEPQLRLLIFVTNPDFGGGFGSGYLKLDIHFASCVCNPFPLDLGVMIEVNK